MWAESIVETVSEQKVALQTVLSNQEWDLCFPSSYDAAKDCGK